MCRNARSGPGPLADITSHHHLRSTPLNIQLTLAPILALLAGILILVRPRLLAYIVAVYLIVIGLIGIFGGSGFRLN
jgi:Protein of unknown function (DUF3096)